MRFENVPLTLIVDRPIRTLTPLGKSALKGGGRVDNMEFLVEVLKCTVPVVIAVIVAQQKNAHPHKRSSNHNKRG